MGTETKINCYTKNSNSSTSNVGIPKVIKGCSSTTNSSSPSTNTYYDQKIIKQNTQTKQNGHTVNNKINGKDVKLNGTSQNQQQQQQQQQQGHSSVPFVPIFIDENNVIDGAKEILKVIRPHWNINAVEFKKFTDGITNKLVGCFYNEQNVQQTNGKSTIHNITENTTRINGVTAAGGHDGKNENANIINEEDVDADADADINEMDDVEDDNEYEINYVDDAVLAINTMDDVNDDDGVDDDDDEDENNDSGNLSDSEPEHSDTEEASTSSLLHNDANDASSNNVVLVRVYGNKTDLLIDRKAETRNILLLHSYDFAPSLYATFKNGLAYDYVPGVTLNTNNVLEHKVWSLVAKRMAEMHRTVQIKQNQYFDGNNQQKQQQQSNGDIILKPLPMLWKKTQSFLDLVPERFTDPDKQRRLEGTFLPISRIRNEFEKLYKCLEQLNSPIVFAHNDLLLGNVIYTEQRNSVNFIDYEYADYNFQAFDIGNHFSEFAGVDVVDYTRYPNRQFQYEWLRVYLQEYLQYTNINDVTDEQVYRLYVQVNQFALASHLFWTIWSLIQAEHSTIDFDYVDYAFIRYKEYLNMKDTFLALDIDGNIPN